MIELLVAVAIVGLLAAIAIPQYATYRRSAFDAHAKNDLRNVAAAEEAYFIDYEAYHSCTDADCSDHLPGLGLITSGVQLQITATATGFTGTATHTKGSGMVCEWDRNAGGLTNCG